MQVWYRGKTGFLVSVALITVLTVSVLIGISLRHGKTQPNSQMANFTCRYASSDATFNVTVKVNLADGMDRDEAIKVAVEVFKVSVNARYALESISVDKAGIWTVRFSWGYEGELLGHWFEAIINPFDQTVVYNRCR